MKFQLVVFCVLFLTKLVSGQEDSDSINKVSFYDIQKSYYEQNEILTSDNIDGSLQKFKRWEWFWEHRVDANGYFPSSDYLYTEKKKINSNTGYSKSISGDWIPQGPYTSQGEQDGMGRLNCIAFHPSDPNTFWVGSPYGGLWKTSNNGMNWSTVTDDLPVLGVSAIVIHPSNPNIMYIVTGDNESQAMYQGIPTGGIFKSIDGGNTWSITGWNVNLGAQISRMLINPNSPLELIVTTSLGVFKTFDGGLTWSNQQSGWFKDIKFKPNDPTIVYATTHSYSGDAQIFKSTNSGDSWFQITSFNTTGRIELGVTPDNPDIVDAVCADYQTWGLEGVYRSFNSGGSFTQLVSGDCISTNMLTNTLVGNGCNGLGYYALCYSINPNNANEIWVGGINLWKSIDGGTTWEISTFNFPGYGKPVVHSDKQFLTYNPISPNTFYTCSDGGLQITTDNGTTWSDISNGLQIGQIYRLNTSANDSNKVLCGLQDNGTKELNNTSWNSRVISWDGMECILDYSNPNIAYAGLQQGGLRRTMDNWSTTTDISTNINGTLYGEGAWITPFTINPENSSSLIIGYNKVYRTYDYGDSWTPISPILTTGHLKTLQIAKSDTNVIYTSTTDSLFLSLDAGATWLSRNTGVGNVSYPGITYLTIHPGDPQTLWLTYYGSSAGDKVFESKDAGQTWINLSGSLPNVSINCLEYQEGSLNGVYVGTDLGVFYRDDTMSDWVPFNTGLPNVVVSELEISYLDNSIWAATYGRGLWKSDLCCSEVGLDEKSNNEFSVIAYPNPSNGFVTLENTLDGEINYDVFIYNVLGKEIIRKTSNINPILNIDLDQHHSGIYFIKVKTSFGSQTVRVLLQE